MTGLYPIKHGVQIISLTTFIFLNILICNCIILKMPLNTAICIALILDIADVYQLGQMATAWTKLRSTSILSVRYHLLEILIGMAGSDSFILKGRIIFRTKPASTTSDYAIKWLKTYNLDK